MFRLTFDCESCGEQLPAREDAAGHEPCPVCAAPAVGSGRSPPTEGRRAVERVSRATLIRWRRAAARHERAVARTEQAIDRMEPFDEGHELQWVGRRLYVRGGDGQADEVCIGLPRLFRHDDFEELNL